MSLFTLSLCRPVNMVYKNFGPRKDHILDPTHLLGRRNKSSDEGPWLSEGSFVGSPYCSEPLMKAAYTVQWPLSPGSETLRSSAQQGE